jgi:hypothetical protein
MGYQSVNIGRQSIEPLAVLRATAADPAFVNSRRQRISRFRELPVEDVLKRRPVTPVSYADEKQFSVQHRDAVAGRNLALPNPLAPGACRRHM